MPTAPALATLLSLTLLLAWPAAAQPRACAVPPGPLQATLCQDDVLRALDARLRALEPEVAAAELRRATVTQRARDWHAALAAEAPDRAALRDAYAARIAALEEVLRQARALRRIEQRRGADGRLVAAPGGTIPRPATLEQRCLGAALRDCRVTGAGVALAEDGRTRVLWQIQEGFTEADGVRSGIVLLAEVAGGVRLLGWSFEGHGYEAPRILPAEGGALLHVRGRAGGMGRANGDLLFRNGPRGWEEIETESWRAALPGRLPAGLELRQAVTYDFEQMAAEATLARPEDANCCPSGGSAQLDFRIEGTGLVLAGVGLDAIARAVSPRAASCPAERATYRLDAPAEWTLELRREGPPASAASDLLLRLVSGAGGREYWFRFAAAQGYGGLTIWPVAAPGPETAEDGVRDLETDDAMRLDVHPITDELAILPDPPRSGVPAPRRLFTPALGRALHYGELPQQAQTGAAREPMPPGFWVLSACR
ncbi:hypothetical protein KTR66_15110 [Roseococcus sp. SDR]|uniref:hypothetical protein n=1 Tax=Roseococcus sp. SDR TaxID=2835532 RepID=UPI001BD10667|nr:hypothetical protein [Roseococcus sp. SDR]MBS7791331.1 hypothetical protein [Roseococcus sp. SDR]MBV1846645.1 hypothetical protein [Roseococcus sp. SDR]